MHPIRHLISLTANNQASHTAIQWPIIFELIIHKLRPLDLLLLRHCLLDWLLLRGRHIFLPGLLVVLSVVISIIEMQFLLYPGDQGGYLMQRYLILFENMRMLSVELASCLLRIRV